MRSPALRSTADLDLPIVVDRKDATPLHQQLAAGLRDAIRAGLVPPDGRLPSTRVLAACLGLARSTVLAAYQQLDGEGYLQPRHGSGTYLSPDVRPISEPTLVPSPSGSPAHGSADRNPRPPAHRDMIDLRPGQPDTSRLVDPAWNRAWRDAVKNPPPAVEPPPQGLPELREEIAAHLAAARGLRVHPDDIFVTSGTSDGLSVLVYAMRLNGRTVAVEDPGYPEARNLLVRQGCTPLPVPADADGLMVDALPEDAPPPLTLVTPSHQYPLGGRLPVSRRLALLAWADRHNATIAEDDYDSEFRFDVAPLPALAGLDRTGRVVHLGTFSKVVSPWLRVGYLVAPRRLVPDLLAVRDDLGIPTSGVDQQALAAYMRQGGLRRHIARTRRDYRHTRSHLIRLLARHDAGVEPRGADAGLHIVLELPEGTDAGDVIGHARRRGVLLCDLGDFAVAGVPDRPAVVLGYGGATLAQLDRAADAIVSALRSPRASRTRHQQPAVAVDSRPR